MIQHNIVIRQRNPVKLRSCPEVPKKAGFPQNGKPALLLSPVDQNTLHNLRRYCYTLIVDTTAVKLFESSRLLTPAF